MGGQLLHSLQQARRLGILPSLDSPLQLVCKETCLLADIAILSRPQTKSAPCQQ